VVSVTPIAGEKVQKRHSLTKVKNNIDCQRSEKQQQKQPRTRRKN